MNAGLGSSVDGIICTFLDFLPSLLEKAGEAGQGLSNGISGPIKKDECSLQTTSYALLFLDDKKFRITASTVAVNFKYFTYSSTVSFEGKNLVIGKRALRLKDEV